MRATIPYIKQKFDEFNSLCFAGRLPPIAVELSNAKTFLGMCVFKKRRTIFGKTENYDFRLRISTRFDLPEADVEDTIIHEMIHYCIALDNIPDTSAHGRVFRGMMNNINRNFNRSVTISRRIPPEQREQAYGKRGRYHVIAVVTFTDGRTGFKVLPRIRERILNYYNKVGAVKGVESVSIYMSNAAFFERYPNSGALSVHYADRPTLMEHLRDADVLSAILPKP